MATGRVKWFNDRRGYGFIALSETGEEVFVHHTAIQDPMEFRTLVMGQIVEFELIHGNKGLQAYNVQARRAMAEARR